MLFQPHHVYEHKAGIISSFLLSILLLMLLTVSNSPGLCLNSGNFQTVCLKKKTTRQQQVFGVNSRFSQDSQRKDSHGSFLNKPQRNPSLRHGPRGSVCVCSHLTQGLLSPVKASPPSAVRQASACARASGPVAWRKKPPGHQPEAKQPERDKQQEGGSRFPTFPTSKHTKPPPPPLLGGHHRWDHP